MTNITTTSGAGQAPEGAHAREQEQAVPRGEGAVWDDTPNAIADCRAQEPQSANAGAHLARAPAVVAVPRAVHRLTTRRKPLNAKEQSEGDKYLKVRVSRAVHEALFARSGEAGQRISTFVREVIERDLRAITTADALARIEALLAERSAVASAAPAPADHELRREVREVRLFVRELAMQMNAQIAARVAAQLAAEPSQSGR